MSPTPDEARALLEQARAILERTRALSGEAQAAIAAHLSAQKALLAKRERERDEALARVAELEREIEPLRAAAALMPLSNASLMSFCEQALDERDQARARVTELERELDSLHRLYELG